MKFRTKFKEQIGIQRLRCDWNGIDANIAKYEWHRTEIKKQMVEDN